MPPHPDSSTQTDRPLGWWVRGHRVHNLNHFGITQMNATRGRSRDRHGKRAGSPGCLSREEKEKRKADTFPTEQMKMLMDNLWARRNKYGNQHPNFWAMAPQISHKYRPSFHQVSKFDWEDINRNPYPGWKLAAAHTPSGWKMGVMTDAEFTKWDSQPQNRWAQDRKEAQQKAATTAARVQTKTEESSSEDETEDGGGNPTSHAHSVALHRWKIFIDATCKALTIYLRPEEQIELLKSHFDVSSLRAHRTDVVALLEDITQCRRMQQTFDYLNNIDDDVLVQNIDWEAKELHGCIYRIFKDIIKIKQCQYKNYAQKHGLPNPETTGSQTWADMSEDVSDYSDDSQQPETSAGDWARCSLMDLQSLHELQISRNKLNPETRQIYGTIGCAQNYIDLKFLNNCLPDHYPERVTRTTPFMVAPISEFNENTPTIFLLTSTNPFTVAQFIQTHDDLTDSGLRVIPLLGLDGEKVSLMKKNAWRRAFISWGQNGFPDAISHIRKYTESPADNETFWWLFAEDSCKIIKYESQGTLLSLIRQAIYRAPKGIEILQLGYRKLTGKKLAKSLNLETMERHGPERSRKILRVMGQKLFAATTRGVELLHRRLLEGPVDYFDTCMHELTLAGKVQRSEFPLAGSRAHYSLVNGGQMLAEEIPGRND